jgi:hypothetical protein
MEVVGELVTEFQ